MTPTRRLDYQASIDRPCLALPDGKRVAVFIVVNVENWDIERAMPRQVLTAPQGASVHAGPAQLGVARIRHACRLLAAEGGTGRA